MSKILFCGLGHLGHFFVKQNNSHEIFGTRRNVGEPADCELIKFSLGEEWMGPWDFDVIIISFPPVEGYAVKLEKLLSTVGGDTLVIFVSSTSVYGAGHITEKSEKNPQTKNAYELIACEKLISTHSNFIVVRPGGLIDHKRHPKNFVMKMVKLTNSMTNVNLVNTEDVAAFLHFVIDHKITNEDFNLVCDDHPTKEEFYSRFSDDLIFDTDNSELRIIDNSKSKSTGFKYQFKNFDWLI